jgi:DNA-binding LacI/PurR family transcriptional regulator/signal transduction histidine kinase
LKIKNIGYLTFDVAGTYNHQMWQHLSAAVSEKGMRLVTFCGGILYGEGTHQQQWNKIYNLVSSSNVEGLIVLSASLGQTCGTSSLIGFLQRFSPIPIVSIGLDLPGIPSVVVDNGTGMRELTDHLIKHHSIKRPLFLMGPRNNDEANLRCEAFKDTLDKNGISFDTEFVKYADFRYDKAMQVIDSIVDNRVEFDSIIAANDDMAMGAIDALNRRGIFVPDEILVTGFDDSSAALFCSVPLTTVKQPHEILLREGLVLLLDMLYSKPVADLTTLRSEIVVRKSCGCSGFNYITVADFSFEVEYSDPDVFLQNNIFENESYSELLGKYGVDLSDCTWKTDLWKFYREIVETNESSNFIERFNYYIKQSDHRSEMTIQNWHVIVSFWNYVSIKMFSKNESLLLAVEDSFSCIRFYLTDRENNLLLKAKTHNQQKDFLMIIFNSYFSPVMEVENFLKYLQNELPKFGVLEFYVNLFEPDNINYCRHIMNFKRDGSIFQGEEGKIFETTKLLPDGISGVGSNVVVIEPLINYEVLIGFLVFVTDGPIELIENIRQIVCNSLITIMLVQEVMKDKQLKILMYNLQEKQKELETAYQSLKENQNKMLVIEKMASLGRMTAGIAHEMNSPLAAVRASLAEMTDLIQEYSESIGDSAVGVDDHHEIASEMKRSLQLSVKAAEKAASFVHGIKAQTRDLTYKERIAFNAVTVIDEAILLISHAVKKSHTVVNFSHDSDDVTVYGVPGRLSQIITNMINNSIDACNSRIKSVIDVSLKVIDSSIVLYVSDNGLGIAPGIITKIFDPIFTTKPFGSGTGLGLTLVHDIVTTDFNGTINVRSVPDEGTTFTISFPKPEGIGGQKT